MAKPFILSQRSRDNLRQVHPDLILIVGHAITVTPVDFIVIEGARNRARQTKLVDSGASLTMDSMHIPDESGYCHAVDVMAYVGGEGRWDWPLYPRIAAAFKQAAERHRLPIEWGGDWPNLRDGPHFQLPRHYRRSTA